MQGFDHRLRFDGAAVLVVTQTVAGTPLLNRLPPIAQRVVILRFLVLRQQLQHLNQHLLGIADDRNIGVHRFGDRGRIDIDVQHSGVRAIFSEIIRGAIVEAHADGENHVGMVHGFVGFIGAVHAEHADALTMGAGEGAQSHQAAGHRRNRR